MTALDVLVVGSGPAGTTAALNLAHARSVLVVERADLRKPVPRIGESLIPAARRLLADMGLLDAFLAEPHLPWFGNRSRWGSGPISESDFTRDPDGHGWHLDRSRFDEWLRAAAVARGARILCPLELRSASWDGDAWSVELGTGSESRAIRARVLIDATGKFATVARRLGAHRRSDERKSVALWLHGSVERETPSTAGFTTLDSVSDGWWYTSPLPGGRRVVAFHTSPSVVSSRSLRESAELLRCLEGAPLVAEQLRESGFRPLGDHVKITVASGGYLTPCAGEDWFAVGDAAVHFDPLSSQGIFNALYTGFKASRAVERCLAGDPIGAASDYGEDIESVRAAYSRHRKLWYAMEDRFPESPFWRA